LSDACSIELTHSVPTLAPHFGVKPAFEFNKETQLFPIVGLVSAELNRQSTAGPTKDAPSSSNLPLHSVMERHHSYLVETVAKEAGCEPTAIVDFELVLYDTQKSCLMGLNEELISSPRLDNLSSTYNGVAALIKSVESESALDNDSTIRVLACFDHEVSIRVVFTAQ